MPMDFPMETRVRRSRSVAPTQLATVVGNLPDHGKALETGLGKFLRC